MVRSTLQPERMCRQLEIPAFFGETVQFPGQEGEAGLFYQGYLPAADVAKVYVHGDERLLVTRSFRHDRPPRVDDVRIAPENELILLSDPVDEDDLALEHAGVKAGDVPPVFPRIQQLRVRV